MTIAELCSNCEMDIAERNPYHRCRAMDSSCIDGTDCPDFVECSCVQCWPIDEEHNRYYGPEVY